MTASACASVSPPVRTTHYGTPGRVDQHDLEFGGAFGSPGDRPYYGGPRLGYGVRDWVSLEAGSENWEGLWAMAFGGPRFTLNPDRERKIHGAADLELGLGVGVGGIASPAEGDTPHRRFALGSYVGGGVGLHLWFFSMFARGRLQTTVAEGLPGTLIWTSVAGMQLSIVKRVDVYGAIGAGGARTAVTHALGEAPWSWIYEFGLMIHFDVLEVHESVKARRARRSKRTRRTASVTRPALLEPCPSADAHAPRVCAR